MAHIKSTLRAFVYINLDENCTLIPKTSSTYIRLNEWTTAKYNWMKNQNLLLKHADEKTYTKKHSGPLHNLI